MTHSLTDNDHSIRRVRHSVKDLEEYSHCEHRLSNVLTSVHTAADGILTRAGRRVTADGGET